MPEKKPYFSDLASHRDEIRADLKPKALESKLTYDETEFKKAEPEVRIGLGRKWMDKLRAKLSPDQQGGKPEDFHSKVFGRLWIVPGTTSNEEKVKIIKEFQETHKLTADGIIGPQTLEALDRESGGEGNFDKPVQKLDPKTKLPTGKVYSEAFVPLPVPGTEIEPPLEEKPKLTEEQKEARRNFRQAKTWLEDAQKSQNETVSALRKENAKVKPAEEDVESKTLAHNEAESYEELMKQWVEEKTKLAETAESEAVQKTSDTLAAGRAITEAEENLKQAMQKNDEESITPKEGDLSWPEQKALELAKNKETAAIKAQILAEKAAQKASWEKEEADTKYKLAQEETRLAKEALDKAGKTLEGITNKVTELGKTLLKTSDAEQQAEDKFKAAKTARDNVMNPPTEQGPEEETESD